MILLTGASGNLGRFVLYEVRKSGASFRALYRGDDDARMAPQGTTAFIGDFSDKPSLLKALDGVDAAYLVCSPVPSLVELESNVIEACVESGVKHVVLNSALGAGDYPKSFPAWHRQVEDKLKVSGLGYTILRPNGFMQNILAYLAPSIRQQSAFYAAMGDAPTSFIDAHDIAAVVAKVLLHPEEHTGKTYELNGPEAISYAQLADKITAVAGRPIGYVDVPEAAQREAMLGQRMPEWQVEALLDLQRYYTGGRGGEVTAVLPRLLGRPPRTVDEFLREFAESFRANA